MEEKLIILISLLGLICILAIYYIVRNFYKIPDIDSIRRILKNSDVDGIYIATKLFGVTKIKLTDLKVVKKEIPKIEPVPEIQRPFLTIYSKMVGTFYSCANEDSDPYVELGDIIKPGDIVGHTTAMHIDTDIVSEIEGKVIKLLIDNGAPVEYGQEIMHIEQ